MALYVRKVEDVEKDGNKPSMEGTLSVKDFGMTFDSAYTGTDSSRAMALFVRKRLESRTERDAT